MTALATELTVGTIINDRWIYAALPIGSTVGGVDDYTGYPVLTKLADDHWEDSNGAVQGNAGPSVSGRRKILRVGPEVGPEVVAHKGIGEPLICVEDFNALPVGAVICYNYDANPALNYTKHGDGTWVNATQLVREPHHFTMSGLMRVRSLPDMAIDLPVSEPVVDVAALQAQLTDALERITAEQARARAAEEGRERDRARVEQWRQEFNVKANEYADENSLCHRYDNFMEENGFEGRSRSYNVYFDVTSRVCITVTAANSDSAVEEAENEMCSEGDTAMLGRVRGEVTSVDYDTCDNE